MQSRRATVRKEATKRNKVARDTLPLLCTKRLVSAALRHSGCGSHVDGPWFQSSVSAPTCSHSRPANVEHHGQTDDNEGNSNSQYPGSWSGKSPYIYHISPPTSCVIRRPQISIKRPRCTHGIEDSHVERPREALEIHGLSPIKKLGLRGHGYRDQGS